MRIGPDYGQKTLTKWKERGENILEGIVENFLLGIENKERSEGYCALVVSENEVLNDRVKAQVER